MADNEARTFNLPAERADYIDRLVATGAYQTPEDVVAAGLEALEDRDAEIDDWLRKEVVPVSAQMVAEPHLAIPAKAVFDEIRERHLRRKMS